jgi:hypothetical protein
MSGEILSQGEIVIEGRLVDASNATLFVQIHRDGKIIRAIYKPIAGERPLWDFPDGNLAQRERASYLISEVGGFHLIPETILRDGPFGLGMVQRWIDIDESINLEEYFQERSPQLRSTALLDAIINNTDRKIGHLLPTAEGSLFLCDHGVTFHEIDKLRTVLWQWAGENLADEECDQLRKLRTSITGDDGSELRELITEVEFAALLQRIDTLLGSGTFPIPRADWPHIPWPPF